MGAKSVFKRYKNYVYLACCIVAGLFLAGCQYSALYRTVSPSMDSNEKEYLAAIGEMVLNKDFKAAAAENQRILEYYSLTPDMNDMVSSNYVQNAEIISELLARIMDEENRLQVLSTIIESNEEQIKILTVSAGSFKKKIGVLEKKLVAMDRLSGKVKKFEKEKELLKRQIDRLKEIDLNPDPVGSKLPAE